METKAELKEENRRLKAEITYLTEQLRIGNYLYAHLTDKCSDLEFAVADWKRKVPLIKDAADVTGIWDITGGVDPVEHIRKMRG